VFLDAENRFIVVGFARLKRLKISTKFSSVLGAALAALCIMGAIAVLSSREIQDLGRELYTESSQFSSVEMAVSVNVERAIGAVRSAPSELDLELLKAKRESFHTLLGEARKTLSSALADSAAAGVRAGADGIVEAVDAFEAVSIKVFEKATSFAQQEAMTALSDAVAPAELALQKALEQFRAAANQHSAEKETAIQALTDDIASIVIGLAILLVVAIAGLGYATVSRGIARPIIAINGVMMRLSSGDASVTVPYTHRLDEIGDMAHAVQVFKDNAIEMERLKAEQQAQERRAAEERRTAMLDLASKFEASVGSMVDAVAAASTELQTTAGSMSSTTEESSRQATAVAAASEEASVNVQTVAAATGELSASVNEISRQVAKSAEIAGGAVTEAERTNVEVQSLAQAAQKIGEVIQLITDIAGQTNLLALNATIEAARAGDAGKGFAVVASEVKNLATQTARATEEISTQIGAIQAATSASVAAIAGIGGTIKKIDEIAAAIAGSIEEQGAATREIANNVQQAAMGTAEVSANIVGVTKAARETGAAAGQVLSSAGELADLANRLRGELGRFLEQVRAA
jgi:methyl-accepting chemotaxis protein